MLSEEKFEQGLGYFAWKYQVCLESADAPAHIARSVGDNVGDAGMGTDLFGSYAESTSAALVLGASPNTLVHFTNALTYPVLISSLGIAVGDTRSPARDVQGT